MIIESLHIATPKNSTNISLRHLVFTIILGVFSYSICAAQDNTKLKDSIYQQFLLSFKLSEEGKHIESLKIINSALTLAKEIDDKNLIGMGYESLGLSHSFADFDQKKAIEYYLKAEEVYKKNKLVKPLSLFYNNIGYSYNMMGDKQTAIECFTKALKYAKNNKENALPNYNLGHIYYELEKYEKAESCFLKSLKLSTKDSIVNDIGWSNMALTDVKMKKKEYDSAYFYINQAERIYKKNKLADLKTTILKAKLDLEEAQGNYNKALNHSKEYIAHKDSIIIKDQSKVYKEIEAKYLLKSNNERLKKVEEQNKKRERTNYILYALSSLLIALLIYLFFVNKNLEKAKRKAEFLSQVKSKFYSEISHELRTPLYSIIELSNLLKTNKSCENQKDNVESLKFSADYLLNLINNVLEFNKINSKKSKVEPIRFNLHELITKIITSFNYLTKLHNNTLELSYDNNIPSEIIGDSLKLSQILINLISNALKFTKNGNVTVTIKCLENEKNNIKIGFEVADNGIGIKKENQSLIFNKYHQEDGEEQNNYIKGSGLGLSIVSSLIKKLNSKINLQSEFGKGSTFSFNITFKKVAVQKQDSQKKEANLSGLKILLVDDNLVNLKITKRIIEKLNGKCDSVSESKQSIELLKKQNYDCVLMDFNMPVMNGLETSKVIRTFDTTTPIILLTAAAPTEIAKKIDNLIVDAYIIKPFVYKDFSNTILSTISKKTKKNS